MARPQVSQSQQATPGLFALARSLPQPWVDGERNPEYQSALKALRDIWFQIDSERREDILYFESQEVLGQGKDPATLFGLYSANGQREQARRVNVFARALRLIPTTVTQKELVKRGIAKFTQKGNLHYNLFNVTAEAIATLLEEVGKEKQAGKFRGELRQIATKVAERQKRRDDARAKQKAEAKAPEAEAPAEAPEAEA